MIFDLVCTQIERWSIVDGTGSCPDCFAMVPADSIDNHVQWHQQLVCQLLAVCANQDQLAELTLELNPENPGECVRLMHGMQIDGLRNPDR